MDLAVGAQRVFIVMEHTTRDGRPRLVATCSLPVTARGVVKLVVTNVGLFEPVTEGFLLREIAPGVDVEEIKATRVAGSSSPGASVPCACCRHRRAADAVLGPHGRGPNWRGLRDIRRGDVLVVADESAPLARPATSRCPARST